MGNQNTLIDLHNLLFNQLKKLNDKNLTQEELEKEIKRSSAMVDLSRPIIQNSNTILQAQRLYADEGALAKDSSKLLNMTDEK